MRNHVRGVSRRLKQDGSRAANQRRPVFPQTRLTNLDLTTRESRAQRPGCVGERAGQPQHRQILRSSPSTTPRQQSIGSQDNVPPAHSLRRRTAHARESACPALVLYFRCSTYVGPSFICCSTKTNVLLPQRNAWADSMAVNLNPVRLKNAP